MSGFEGFDGYMGGDVNSNSTSIPSSERGELAAPGVNAVDVSKATSIFDTPDPAFQPTDC